MKYILSILVTCLTLVGCTTKQYIPVPNIESLGIPETLFIYPPTPKPGATPEEYITLSSEEKEKMLVDYNIDLLEVLKALNIIIKNIEEYSIEHKQRLQAIIKEYTDGKLN